MSTKVILFLSTTLTAFVLATLYGVVTTIDTNPAPVQAAAVQATDATTDVPTQEFVLPVVTEPAPLTPDKAAWIASEAIHRQDVYSVEYKTNDQGVEGFEVVFSSNDIVFISMNEMVYSISALPTQVVYTYVEPPQPTKAKSEKNNKNNKNDNDHEDDHEDDDDDEDEHED